MITPKHLVRHELIGLKVKIVNSTNKQIIGLTGKVVDETRNILRIETTTGKNTKNFVKDQCIFSFKTPSGEWVRIDGKLLVARPEDRIKKKLEKW